MSYLENVILEMAEALVKVAQNFDNILNELLNCFNDEKEKEKTQVSSPKTYGMLLENVSYFRTKSFYRQPYVQVPRHLAYQKRHYQS